MQLLDVIQFMPDLHPYEQKNSSIDSASSVLGSVDKGSAFDIQQLTNCMYRESFLAVSTCDALAVVPGFSVVNHSGNFAFLLLQHLSMHLLASFLVQSLIIPPDVPL